MFRICPEFSAIFRIFSNVQNLFRIFSNVQNLFRIFSNFQNFQNLFRIFRNVQNLFRIFSNFQNFQTLLRISSTKTGLFRISWLCSALIGRWVFIFMFAEYVANNFIIYAAKFEQKIIHQDLHLWRESRSHVHVLMRL